MQAWGRTFLGVSSTAYCLDAIKVCRSKDWNCYKTASLGSRFAQLSLEPRVGCFHAARLHPTELACEGSHGLCLQVCVQEGAVSLGNTLGCYQRSCFKMPASRAIRTEQSRQHLVGHCNSPTRQIR